MFHFNQTASAISGVIQWDDDGGSQLKASAVARAVDQLDEDDQLILGFLGASLLSLWDDLPASEQQKLLNSQAIKSAFDKAEIKTRIQRLEEHFKRLK
ncbi:hypothetical protein GWQ43_09485 [Alcaligenes faecalis]|nr:hypothetical protein GWQ43_09485 [Alcaligenes faecalis]